MNREIKFRVFIKWLKITLEVESIDFIKKRVYCKTEIVKQNPCDFYNFDDVVIMQYIGLKDKNGVEIYEGDIVKVAGTDENNDLIYRICEVTFNKGSYVFRFQKGFYFYHNSIFEVIGNIYENPELLEK